MTRQPSASGRIAVTFSVKRTTREPVSAAKSTEALAGALSVVGTRSAFLVLREAFYGTSRFGGFVQRTGLSEPIAAANLRQLVDEGLLERTDYRDQGRRTRQGYRLTAKGADLIPALLALMQWGDRWLFRGRGPGRGTSPRLRRTGDGAAALHRRSSRRFGSGRTHLVLGLRPEGAPSLGGRDVRREL
jgi:DNA-binding HxlR family transcriptional regulator